MFLDTASTKLSRTNPCVRWLLKDVATELQVENIYQGSTAKHQPRISSKFKTIYIYSLEIF